MTIIEYENGHEKEIKELIVEFHKESLGQYGFDMAEKLMDQTLDLCKDKTLLMFEGATLVGIIGGYLTRAMTGNKILWNEVMWYVSKKYRRWGVRLYRAMEAKLYAEGIQLMMMVSIKNDSHEQVDRLYKKLGYTPFEVQYIKDLGE